MLSCVAAASPPASMRVELRSEGRMSVVVARSRNEMLTETAARLYLTPYKRAATQRSVWQRPTPARLYVAGADLTCLSVATATAIGAAAPYR